MERVCIRIESNGYSICFLDSYGRSDCNPGMVMYHTKPGGHGEGRIQYACNGNRPATEDEARKALADYCREYDCNPADFRIVKRHTLRQSAA